MTLKQPHIQCYCSHWSIGCCLQWPTLLPELVERLKGSEDLGTTLGVAATANSIFKRYRNQYSSNELVAELADSQAAFAPKALETTQRLVAQLPSLVGDLPALRTALQVRGGCGEVGDQLCLRVAGWRLGPAGGKTDKEGEAMPSCKAPCIPQGPPFSLRRRSGCWCAYSIPSTAQASHRWVAGKGGGLGACWAWPLNSGTLIWCLHYSKLTLNSTSRAGVEGQVDAWRVTRSLAPNIVPASDGQYRSFTSLPWAYHYNIDLSLQLIEG